MSFEPPVPPPPPPPSSDGDDIYRPGGVPNFPGQDQSNPYSQGSGTPGAMPPSMPEYPGQSYESPGYAGVYPQDHPSGTTILVLGILGLLLCAPVGIAAWVMGNNALKEMEASGAVYTNVGTIKAGKILGIVATAFMALGVIFSVVLVATGGFFAFFSGF